MADTKPNAFQIQGRVLISRDVRIPDRDQAVPGTERLQAS